MAELADARDLGSRGVKPLRVRIPPLAPSNLREYRRSPARRHGVVSRRIVGARRSRHLPREGGGGARLVPGRAARAGRISRGRGRSQTGENGAGSSTSRCGRSPTRRSGRSSSGSAAAESAIAPTTSSTWSRWRRTRRRRGSSPASPASSPSRRTGRRSSRASDRPTSRRAGRRGRTEIEPNLVLIGAPQVWDRGFTGQGIVVGIADTGVGWRHPALIGHYRGWDGAAASHAYNWHDAIHETAALNPCGVDSPEPCDDEGHGTAIAGLAVGDDGGANRIGVAPGARWIGCRNMDLGAGTPARYIECFEFFLAPTDANGENPRPDLGADVINNSWTCQVEEGCADPGILRAVVEGLRAAGVAGVFAAGNSGPSCASLSAVPAIYDEAFTVGATYLTDVIANFSARGPVTRDGSHRVKPDICAPGVSVRTSSDRSPSELYEIFAGTSGASPHVAGAIALLWSRGPVARGRRGRHRGSSRSDGGAAAVRDRLRRASRDRRSQPGLRLGTDRRRGGARGPAGARLARAGRGTAPRSPRPARSSLKPPETRIRGRRLRGRPSGDKIRALMPILSTKEESPTRTVLEIEIPAEEVEKAFAAVRRAYARKAALPGFPQGQGPRGSRRQALRRRDQGRRAREPPARRGGLGDRGAQARDPRPAARRGPDLGAARADPFPGAPRPEAGRRPRGVPRASRSRISRSSRRTRRSPRSSTASARRTPSSTRSRGARRRRATSRSPTSRARSSRSWRPARTPGPSATRRSRSRSGTPTRCRRSTTPCGERCPGTPRSFRKTFADDFPNDEFRGKTVDYQVTLAALKEKKLPAVDDEFARAVSEGSTVETLREKVRGAAAAREGSRPPAQVPPGDPGQAPRPAATSPRRRSWSSRRRRAALRDYARYLAASGVDPEKEDWEKLREEARPGAERRVREYLLLDAIADREGIAGLRHGARGRVQAGRRRAGRRAGRPARADGEGGRPRGPARRDAPGPGRRPLDCRARRCYPRECRWK